VSGPQSRACARACLPESMGAKHTVRALTDTRVHTHTRSRDSRAANSVCLNASMQATPARRQHAFRERRFGGETHCDCWPPTARHTFGNCCRSTAPPPYSRRTAQASLAVSDSRLRPCHHLDCPCWHRACRRPASQHGAHRCSTAKRAGHAAWRA
jgi:hypothetical protein